MAPDDAVPAAHAEKLRLRTDGELAAQAAGLAELCDVLAVRGVPHWVSGGTLLGAARDGDFIRWDWDVEVSVRTEDVAGRLDELADALTAAGFALAGRDDDPANVKLVVARDGAVYELQAYRAEGEWRTRAQYRTRQRFFDQAGTVTLRGRTDPALGPVDAYLTDRYGDWRTPKRTADKSAYLAPGYFRVPAWRRTLRTWLAAARRRLGASG